MSRTQEDQNKAQEARSGARGDVTRRECGFEARTGDEAAFVAQAQAHAREIHGVEFSREEILALAGPVELQGRSRPAPVEPPT